jgi:transposase
MLQSMSRRKANCAADEADRIVAERKISSCSDVIVAWLMKNAPDLARAGMETGPLAVWRWNELHDKGLPIVCMDARRANAPAGIFSGQKTRLE